MTKKYKNFILKDISKIFLSIKKDLVKVNTIEQLNLLYAKFLGKKGLLKSKFQSIKKLSLKNRIEVGKIFNQIKKKIEIQINFKKERLEIEKINYKINKNNIDISLPGRKFEKGSMHPITNTINRIEDIFSTLGFKIVFGQEIEDNFHNFDALNIPKFHPARNEEDTFWFDEKRLLRTQTSNVQIRIMKEKIPCRILSSGKVYRKDYDKNHTPMFHQTEGIIIDSSINFSNLKNIMYNFLEVFFKKKIKIRFRPSYFPFTEPSAEIDIKNSKNEWVEVLGCGMIHPNVLNNVGIQSDKYQGCAFGIGIERITSLLYNIFDIRQFFKNNLRFLKQFK